MRSSGSTRQKAGAEATLELPVAAAGKYNLVVYYTTAKDYGIVQALVDGKEVGSPTDCYTPDVKAKGRACARQRRPDSRPAPHHVPRDRQKRRIFDRRSAWMRLAWSR